VEDTAARAATASEIRLIRRWNLIGKLNRWHRGGSIDFTARLLARGTRGTHDRADIAESAARCVISIRYVRRGPELSDFRFVSIRN